MSSNSWKSTGVELLKYPSKEIANVCEKMTEFAFKNFSDKDGEFTDIPLQTKM